MILRSSAVAALVVVALVVLAAPAMADPAEPGRYASEVIALEPQVDGVQLEVVGGDAFLELTVERGLEVEVPGYDGEPYLRVLADGTVEQNERSPATYLNEDRFGTVAPQEADAEAEPRWVEVATGGTYAWHDHRVHWMRADPPLNGGTGLVHEWEVPLTVDGQEVVATGRLVREPALAPWPWLALVAVVGGLAWAVGRRRPGWGLAACTVVGGGIATFVGWRAVASQPEAAGASPLPFALGAVALGLAVVGLAVRTRRSGAVLAQLAGLASAAVLGGWVILRFTVLTEPVLPTDLVPWIDRAGTALVFGLALAAAVLGVQAGGAARREGPEHDDPSGDRLDQPAEDRPVPVVEGAAG